MPQGRLTKSARSQNSEMEIDGTEPELAKLHRQLRIMEGDRQAYIIQAREQIRKQQKEIEKLLSERDELHRNLGACTSLSRQQQDGEDTQNLQDLLRQRDEVDEELEKEKQSQNELQKEILSIESKLKVLRRGVVSTSDSHRLEVRRTQKALRTLECKLDRASTQFNEQLTKNSQLKEQLQTLHIERARFYQLHSRLDEELKEVRQKIGKVISMSTSAYDARVEAQSKMTMMREKAVKDLAQYNSEMKELERVIAHEFSLKEFMSAKCSERSGQDNEHEMGQLSEPKDQKRVDSREESLDALEEVFERIQTVTGEDNLDLLVTRFIQVEDRNFALFNLVNELNKEAETLKEQISQIQDEMEQFQGKSLQQEQHHSSLMKDIEEEQKEAESRAQDYEKKANIISKILDQIKTGVNSIFSKTGCDRSVIEDKLGSSTGISDSNIMSYLAVVEQKTNELLTIQAFLLSKDLEKDYNPKDLAKVLLGQRDLLQQTIGIQPALNSMQHIAEEPLGTDEEERPLSQEELRRKIMKGVMQKEKSAQRVPTKASKINQQRDD
ncbi:coiled-coil domain-containing protein 114 isoform 2-T2 [Menidia menidia]